MADSPKRRGRLRAVREALGAAGLAAVLLVCLASGVMVVLVLTGVINIWQ